MVSGFAYSGSLKKQPALFPNHCQIPSFFLNKKISSIPKEDDSAGSVFGDADDDNDSVPGDEAGLEGGTSLQFTVMCVKIQSPCKVYNFKRTETT